MSATIGQLIRQRRVELGLSLRVAAARLGVSWVYLGSIERGLRPGGARLADIEKVLEMAPGALTEHYLTPALKSWLESHPELLAELEKTHRASLSADQVINQVVELLRGRR